MTKTKSTKRALLLSGLTLLVCVSMLIGSTFAWFTDSVTSSGNIIKSGKLEVEMSWKDAGANVVQATYKDASEGAIFNYEKWEPGYVDAKHIKIENVGTLAFKYQVLIEATGTVSELANVIDVYFAEGELAISRGLTELTRVGTLNEVLSGMPANMSGDLLEGQNDVVTIALKMQESAGNEYQEKSIGSSFAVKLFATQLAYEKDSFNENYDALADYDGEISNAISLQAAFNQGGNFKMTDDVVVPAGELPTVPEGKTVAIDLNGMALSAENSSTEYFLTNLGNLTIWDSKDITTYSLRSTKGSINARGVYNGYTKDGEVVDTATLTILNGVYNALGTDGGAAIFNYATVNIKGGTFTSVGGYSLNNREGAVMNIDNAVVNNGIYNLGTVVVNGGEFENNNSGRHVVYNSGNLTVNNGNFFNNNKGNATILTASNKTVTINGGVFGIAKGSDWTSNIFDVNGGATAVINGGTFNGNLRLNANSKVTINDGYFVDKDNYEYLIYTNDLVVNGGTFVGSNYKKIAKNNLSNDFQLVETDNGAVVAPADYVVTNYSGLYKEENSATYYVYSATGFEGLNKMMANKTAGKNTVIKLCADIDMAGKVWTPVDSHADSAFWFNELDGQGFTVSNLTINGQAMFTRFAGVGNVTIKDVTFDNATVNSNALNSSILTAQTYQNTLLDNVDVKNSSITGAYKVAPLIATVYDEHTTSIVCTVKNCDISNTVVTSTVYDFFTCGMISFVYTTNNDYVEYENCSITDVQLRSVGGGYNYHANIHYTSADTDDQINSHPGVTVTNVTFEKI